MPLCLSACNFGLRHNLFLFRRRRIAAEDNLKQEGSVNGNHAFGDSLQQSERLDAGGRLIQRCHLDVDPLLRRLSDPEIRLTIAGSDRDCRRNLELCIRISGAEKMNRGGFFACARVICDESLDKRMGTSRADNRSCPLAKPINPEEVLISAPPTDSRKLASERRIDLVTQH